MNKYKNGHEKDCLWSTPLPTGFPNYWHCTCGFDEYMENNDKNFNVVTFYLMPKMFELWYSKWLKRFYIGFYFFGVSIDFKR